eukprot:symbB.v1.2.012107.t1/scaffold828.1/size159251/7
MSYAEVKRPSDCLVLCWSVGRRFIVLEMQQRFQAVFTVLAGRVESCKGKLDLVCLGVEDSSVTHFRRVAVVGGGPAGLAACRMLEKFGHHPTVFETSSEVGGIWAPEPANDVVYRGLVTNIPTMCMQSFDLDFPSDTSYVTGPQLGSYMIQYADHFNLRRFIRFGCHVDSVTLESSDAWMVTFHSVENGDVSNSTVSTEEFDAVCVANGHYEFPYLPEIPGQQAWLEADSTRKVVHALNYDDPEDFRGQSVLIVGGRSSAVDVARELRSRARTLYVLESGSSDIIREEHCCRIPLGSKLNEDGTLSLEGEQMPGETKDLPRDKEIGG